MQPPLIRVTFIEITYYVLKLRQSKCGPIINTWTTHVQTLESRRLEVSVGDVSLTSQQLNYTSCAEI